MKKHTLFYSVFLALTLISGNSIYASDLKTRISERKPHIRALKDKSLIGEDNFGYLAFVSANKEGKKIVEAENKDRGIVYATIAKEQKTTPALVGRIRAKQIANIAKSGDYLKKEDGSWYRKP